MVQPAGFVGDRPEPASVPPWEEAVHLVVSGSGQLGTSLVNKLTASDRAVRALVRPTSRYQHLLDNGAELVLGDLRDPPSLRAALAGVDVVLACANIVAPRPSDTFVSVEHAGYRSLIAAAADEGVQRFVFSSVPVTKADEKVPQFRAKRHIEKALIGSGVPYTILRCAPFMEVWLALPGSSIPLRGEVNPSLDRPYSFLRRFRALTGRTIEEKGRMMVIGPPAARNAFVSLHDVAAIMLAVAEDPQLSDTVIDVGGPQVLTWNDVASEYSQILGHEVKVSSLPASLFRALQLMMQPFAPAASNIMGLNHISGTTETPWEPSESVARLGISNLRTVREFLTEKAALPE